MIFTREGTFGRVQESLESLYIEEVYRDKLWCSDRGTVHRSLSILEIELCSTLQVVRHQKVTASLQNLCFKNFVSTFSVVVAS
jgi:hypothetical protein